MVIFCFCETHDSVMLNLLSYMVILTNEQDAQPRTTIALWKANMDEPKFQDPDPTVMILDIPSSNFLILKHISGISLSFRS